MVVTIKSNEAEKEFPIKVDVFRLIGLMLEETDGLRFRVSGMPGSTSTQRAPCMISSPCSKSFMVIGYSFTLGILWSSCTWSNPGSVQAQ